MMTSKVLISGVQSFASRIVLEDLADFGNRAAVLMGEPRREPKGGLLKGGLHFYEISQNDVSSFVSTCFAKPPFGSSREPLV